MELLDEDEYFELEREFGFYAVSEEERDNDDYFFATMGGEAIKEMLSRINLFELKKSLEEIIETSKSKQKRTEALSRLKIVKTFLPTLSKKRINQPAVSYTHLTLPTTPYV